MTMISEELLRDVKAAIRKALTDRLTDATTAESWDADLLLDGCRHHRGMGYQEPEKAADFLATDAAKSVIELLSLRTSPPPSGEAGESWVLVPREPTPEMLAYVAVRVQAAGKADYDLAQRAVALLPPSDHPDVGDILAEIARDYRAMISALPTIKEPTDGK